MNKFIVTSEGKFRFGDVNMHKDLLLPGEDCIGGGMYEFDYAGERMLLWGKSYDFGRVKWSFVDTLIIPENLQGLRIEYEDMLLSDLVEMRYK